MLYFIFMLCSLNYLSCVAWKRWLVGSVGSAGLNIWIDECYKYYRSRYFLSIKQSRVKKVIYNSRTAEPIIMIIDLFDLLPNNTKTLKI